MKPYVLEIPGIITVTLDEQAVMKIHDYYEVQCIADAINKEHPHYDDAYCEVLAKKAHCLMQEKEIFETDAIYAVTNNYPADNVARFAKSTYRILSDILRNNLPEHISDMEDIAEILMTISKNVALYSELPLEKEVKKTLTSILELSDSLQPVTISGPEDVTRLQSKLQLIKQLMQTLL